jgi:hypothetical protein
MRFHYSIAVLAATILCLESSASHAQSVNLTAKPSAAVLPDGQTVSMWGFSCNDAGSAPASCSAANRNAGVNWSPVVITTTPGSLTINLTNNLPVAPGAATGIPTSLIIVGQVGGGLGTGSSSVASPTHSSQSTTTWPIAGPATVPFNPPSQPARVQSFATEVATGATTALKWSNLRPGTYLIESGTHPSIQGPMGLYGVLVVTTPPSAGTAGTAYPGVTYNADVPLVLSEIDPVQNAAVAKAVTMVGFNESTVWSGQPGGCGNPGSSTYGSCYPPAVNYSPLYYLINGVSLDRTNLNNSLFAMSPATGVSGQVLVRLVNAGLRMHVPSIVGGTTGTPLPGHSGFSLIAEDGNLLPGTPRVQNEVFMAAGKTYDVMVNAPVVPVGQTPSALPVFDRQLSLSANNQRDGGMQGYISINGAAAPTTAQAHAVANPDSYFVLPATTLRVNDPGKGVVANDIGVYGVAVKTMPAHGTASLSPDGTFTYIPDASWSSGTTSDSFVYVANGQPTLTAQVTLTACAGSCKGGAPKAMDLSYTSNVASRFHIGPPGVLVVDSDPQGHPLTASTASGVIGGTVSLNADGSFTAVPIAPPTGTGTATVTFTYTAINSQKTPSNVASVTVTFNGGSGLKVNVLDAPVGQVGSTGAKIADYRWIIEEDRTFQVDPSLESSGTSTVQNLGTNFHTSYMPVVASGCMGVLACESGQTVFDNNKFLPDGTTPNPNFGMHVQAVCDVGDGLCRTDAGQQIPVDPAQVHLDPRKHYYISILPGDAGNTFTNGGGAPQPIDPKNPTGPTRQFNIATDCGLYTQDPLQANAANWAPGGGKCGHSMGGAQVTPAQIAGGLPVNVLLQETPFQPSKIAVFVFEDDFPLNGENDAGGGVDILAPNEPGLGGFEIRLWDAAGGTGDATGQMTYDMFNMPLSNSLAGMIDPVTGKDACPINKAGDGVSGRIVTCPKFEADGKTMSPLAGQAVIANMMPGRYGIQATPGADRFSKGEEWLQTNTLDGQKAHDSFIKVGGPAYFQEFGPAGFHVAIGFANPAIINGRLEGVCNGTDINFSGAPIPCKNTITGIVTQMRQSHPPDQRLYSSGTNDALNFSQCYISIGDPDGEDFAFAKCDPSGRFTLSGIPDGDWKITAFDQWNDQIVDGLSTPVRVKGGQTLDMGNVAVQQWHTNVATSTYFDKNGNGVRDSDEQGLALVSTNVRFRDGSFSNFNNTDLNGFANYNEIFPLFNWYLIEADSTRYKSTGVHVVYDGGGPADTKSKIAANLAGTTESSSLPTNLRFPGSVYCGDADCSGLSIKSGPGASATTPSTGRIDPPWVTTEAWQGFIGQYEFLEFGKAPFAPNENGGIRGEVIYASTRPFDDPTLLIHTSWTPQVPNVTVNLYQESTAADGTTSLKLVDTTKTSSWDEWAQGFRSDGIPNMNCPGQMAPASDPFYFTLKDTPFYLDQYNATYNGGTQTTLPYNSQYKCYDGLHNFNQVQPAPYDGKYKFPSVTSRDPKSGAETGTNCTICVANPTGDGTKMLPSGRYVVEMVTPPGYELVKEEDKNILIGDNYIAPVVQEFAGMGNIFILPDQASVLSEYNANNAQNPTNNLGIATFPMAETSTKTQETFWPCVGQARVVPDYISLFPQSKEVAPFAGATRHLCDRKEVALSDQTSVNAKFWVFSSTHVAAHFTGFILDDLSSEFDPFSPQFGEKFAVPNLPVSIKDFAGNEVERVYADQWGVYNGLNYSTWEVNPPNPTGYAPTMMVACMNDPGNGATPDPYFNPSYSKFCYEIPYMPGQNQYMDTPVVPTAAFAEGYNPPDCNYPTATPAIASVIGNDATGSVSGASGKGPWVSGSGSGHTLLITALGPKQVQNPAYTGPQAKTAPYNQKFITRNYTFGSRCTALGGGCSAISSVTIGGVSAPITSWSDSSITVTVPAGVPSCSADGIPLQRNPDPSHSGETFAAKCGQLVITSGSGQKSIDTVTITVGGKVPTYVAGENATNNAIQTAIDVASPGDLIMVGPGVYDEMLLMWKPVRLQGSGAASTTINANTHPSGKLNPWRHQVNCLFGLALNGSLLNAGNAYDPTGQYSCSPAMQGAVDPLPLEGIVGWDTTLNGNLAQLLQEPSLMGAYEGAGITVLAKGENMSIGADGTGAAVTEGAFPPGSRPLTGRDEDCEAFPSNFWCNPSRIDGFTITNSSQGGGGIFAHGWTHNLEVANNRVYGNAGTLSGGINIGQGESPDPIINSVGVQQPFLFQNNVHVHNNSVTANTSYGDELFSATPSAAGGVTFCTGADNYHFNYNWVCGNLSTGDGGGLVHEGFIYNGDISHNWVLFNQSNNITLPAHGGGIAVLGASPDGTTPAGTECGNTVADADCSPGLSDGTGPDLVIDSNVIMGNTAESGSGGGIRLQLVNGTEVVRLPRMPWLWNSVSVTNNIIANNVAGWDGGGISLQDALNVDVINNTIASNDTTASSGVLFNTLKAPNASTPPPGCDPFTNPTCAGNQVVTSTIQPAGLVTMQNTANLTSHLPAHILCPAGHASGGPLNLLDGSCRSVSYPLLANDLFWQNRTFHIQVGGLGTGTLSQQNLVTLLPSLNQTATGQCVPDAGNYWDIGVRGDTGPTNHSSTVTLNPSYSILTSTAGYASSNRSGNPNVVSQYCNGSRVPPELGGTANPFGYQVPPGISDATVPNPTFNLSPAATVDEGNNWINMAYGPLSLANPMHASGTLAYANGTANGNYGLTAGSTPAIGAISGTNPASANNYAIAPALDIFGTKRKTDHAVDIGAVEYVSNAPAPTASVSPSPLAFGNAPVGNTSSAKTLTVTNTSLGNVALTGGTFTFGTQSPQPFSRPAGAAGGTCGATLASGASCTINIVFTPGSQATFSSTLTVAFAGATVTSSPVTLTGTGVPVVQSATLTPATWSPTETRTCPGTGLQALACATGPSQGFTLTNTGNAPLTGILQGVLGGTSAADYSIVPLLSTCGPAGGGQVASTTTLAPGGTCVVRVQFKARLSDPANTVTSATISVKDVAGTLGSALTGLAR